jgi:hypothetical protein
VGTAGPGDDGQDAGQDTGQEQEPSADDARDYARRLRSLPADQVLGEFLFSLLNTAHMKLGRRDARLLIDVAAVAHEHARPYLPDELTRQIEQVLGQLRMGQVNAENHTGKDGKPEENDLDRPPAPPTTSAGQ